MYLGFFFLVLFNTLFYLIFKKFFYIFPQDYPNLKRKKHSKPTPKIGNFLFTSNIIIILLISLYEKEYLQYLKINDSTQYIYLFSYFISLSAISFFEDKYNYSYNTKIIFLSGIISFLIYFNGNYKINVINFFDLNISLGQSAFILSCLILFILKNIFNLFDGIDGQIGSYFLFLNIILYTKGVFFSLLITPSILIFLFLNLNKKAFIGDGGIYILTSFFYINFTLINNSLDISTLEIILITLIPLLDTIRIFFHRIIKNKHPLHGDRNHLHHIILKKNPLLKALILLNSLIILPYILYKFFGEEFFYFIVFFEILLYFIILLGVKKILFFIKK